MPMVPLAVVVLEIAGGWTGAGAIEMVNVALPVPPVLVALKVTEELPAAVGVPLIKPLVALMERPAGRPVAAKLVALLLAVIW